jgi:hypothetical protein
VSAVILGKITLLQSQNGFVGKLPIGCTLHCILRIKRNRSMTQFHRLLSVIVIAITAVSGLCAAALLLSPPLTMAIVGGGLLGGTLLLAAQQHRSALVFAQQQSQRQKRAAR